MNTYNFSPGQKVLMRRNIEDADVWRIAFWGTSDTHFNSGKIDASFDFVPFEGNEHLFLTSNEAGKQRWRAVCHESYYHVDDNGDVTEEKDMRDIFDDEMYSVGNYFRTRNEAESVAEQIKSIFRSHE